MLQGTPSDCAWNPLSFVRDEFTTNLLDLNEIEDISSAVVEVAKLNNLDLIHKPHSPIIGREVGDDRVDLSQSTEKLCVAQAVQERVVKMVTSPEDTGIRRLTWNFCEVTSVIPTDPHTGYDYIRKDGDFSNLGYNDSIILRLILDVQKGAGEDHSSTPTGKMAMLGSRLATPRGELRGTWMIASLFQDAYLSTTRAEEPKYLPQQMGGTGVTALFDNPTNTYYYALAYKGGTYARIYGTAVHELANCLQYLERGLQVAPILCTRLREKQEFFHGTYDRFVAVPNKADLEPGPDGRTPLPLYEATGGVNRYQQFENRLLRTRYVVGRRAAEQEWEHTHRLQNLVSGVYKHTSEMEAYDKDRTSSKRARYGNALRANSALQNLLRRQATESDIKALMGDASYRVITTGRRTFERSDALWVYNNGRTENYSLSDIMVSEDIFSREEVSVEETFKVPGIYLRPITHRGVEYVATKTKVGLWQINSTMEAWAENLHNRLRDERDDHGRPLKPSEIGPIFDEDPEWVNDDSGLIGRCMREHTESGATAYAVILVTADKRLATQMAETSNVTVYRVPPQNYLVRCYQMGGSTVNPLSLEQLRSQMRLKVVPDALYIDTGSLSAASRELEVDPANETKLIRRELNHTGWDGLHRFSSVRLTKTVQYNKLVYYIHYPVQRPKVWRQHSRPASSVYSSHDSWRRSSSAGGSSWGNNTT